MPERGIGFVGAGGVAARHARTLSALPDARLVFVTDADPRRAQRFAETYGLKAVPDIRSVLDSDIDAVHVCVPPFAHGAIEAAIAQAGHALFVERPLGLNAKVAAWIGRILAGAGTVTAVDHHRHYAAKAAARLRRGGIRATQPAPGRPAWLTGS
jgi:myo-inositol 2-dehydrogenase/D-chiro-inositol 1-dehydrogenase